MQYDLGIVNELCEDVDLIAEFKSDNELIIELGEQLRLCFCNIDKDDCLIGFEGQPWHFHGDAQFIDSCGYYIDVDYLNIISGIASGDILICESYMNNELKDVTLIHKKFNDEFQYMKAGEELKVRNFATC